MSGYPPEAERGTNWSTKMDNFKDHCWKNMVTPDILEIYASARPLDRTIVFTKALLHTATSYSKRSFNLSDQKYCRA
jgi:hypothetical protein